MSKRLKNILLILGIITVMCFAAVNIIWFVFYSHYNNLTKNKEYLNVENFSNIYSDYLYEADTDSEELPLYIHVGVPDYLKGYGYVQIGNPLDLCDMESVYLYKNEYVLQLKLSDKILGGYKAEVSYEYIADITKDNMTDLSEHPNVIFHIDSDMNLMNESDYSSEEIEIFNKHHDEILKYKNILLDFFGESADFLFN